MHSAYLPALRGELGTEKVERPVREGAPANLGTRDQIHGLKLRPRRVLRQVKHDLGVTVVRDDTHVNTLVGCKRRVVSGVFLFVCLFRLKD